MARYKFKTNAGNFYIRQQEDGSWSAFFEDEDLGNYETPEQAADDLAGGHTFSASCGDTDKFGISEDLSDWEIAPPPS